jgi:DNA-binding NarL/FixJ family response regulator
VHLHNIIRKLGVHNRTEAAAKFRNFTAAGR